VTNFLVAKLQACWYELAGVCCFFLVRGTDCDCHHHTGKIYVANRPEFTRNDDGFTNVDILNAGDLDARSILSFRNKGVDTYSNGDVDTDGEDSA
jgi:hypothetical protein